MKGRYRRIKANQRLYSIIKGANAASPPSAGSQACVRSKINSRHLCQFLCLKFCRKYADFG